MAICFIKTRHSFIIFNWDLGIDGPLSINEIETVLGWLNFLCTFFHHEGNGPPMEDLKLININHYF